MPRGRRYHGYRILGPLLAAAALWLDTAGALAAGPAPTGHSALSLPARAPAGRSAASASAAPAASPLDGGWKRLPVNAPQPVADATLAWDGADRVMFLFGGRAAGATSGAFWAYRPARTKAGAAGWLHPSANGDQPGARAGAAAVWDDRDGVLLVLDGMQNGRETDALYAYKPGRGVVSGHGGATSGRWADVSAPGAPLRRAYHSAVWDSADGVMILYGGETNGLPLGDTWTYKPVKGGLTPGTWTHLSLTGPAARQRAMAAWDSVDGVMLLAGGTGYNGLFSDLWSFRPAGRRAHASWTRLAATTPLGPRAGGAALWDGADKRFLVFGGQVAAPTPTPAPTTASPALVVQPTGTVTSTATVPPTVTPIPPTTTSTATPIPSATPSNTSTATNTPVPPANTATTAPSATPPPTPTNTATPVPSATATNTATPAPTNTVAASATPASTMVMAGTLVLRPAAANAPAASAARAAANERVLPATSVFTGCMPEFRADARLHWERQGVCQYAPTPAGRPSRAPVLALADTVAATTGRLAAGAPSRDDTASLVNARNRRAPVFTSAYAEIARVRVAGEGRPRDAYVTVQGMVYGDDLWSYAAGRRGLAAGSWQQSRQGGGPLARSATAVYDGADRALLLFGGQSVSALGDVWSYPLAGRGAGRWTSLDGGQPQARAGQAGAWDARDGVLFVFGGYTGARLNDLWAYKPARGVTGRWTLIPLVGPAARTEASLVWDSADNTLLLFGGADAGGSLNDVWAYRPVGDGTAPGRWIALSATGGAPSGRHLHSAVWDGANRQMLVFAGETGPTILRDLWSFHVDSLSKGRGHWSQLMTAATPAARFAQAAVWDPSGARMLVFGGVNGAGGFLDDLWAYSPGRGAAAGRWANLGTPGIPDARATTGAIWDGVDNALIIFGGTGAGSIRNDTYVYRGSWSALTRGGAPERRNGSTAVYDTVNNALLLFGGTGANGALNDLWQLGGYQPIPRTTSSNKGGKPAKPSRK